MKIILSPAKKMQTADDDFSFRDLPVMLSDTEKLLDALRKLDHDELKAVWKCSEKLASENEERIRNMDLCGRLSPALFSYVGLAYMHMAPGAMTSGGLDYLQEHLRILSGFYGVLKPFDGITPYRLEMQSVIPGTGDLYAFWGERIYKALEDHLIINLASEEYSKIIRPYLGKEDRMIDIIFASAKGNRLVTKGTPAKMARGSMVYWMAENHIEDPEEIRRFDEGWKFSPEHSGSKQYVFLENTETV